MNTNIKANAINKSRNILTTLHLIRAGLASGLLTKEEVIDWADEIITNDEQPDIFFIDLAMSSQKNTNEVIHYISDYLNFYKPAIQGRPLVGLLYSRYTSGQVDLEQARSKLFRLKFEAVFSEREEDYIYSLENEYNLAKHGIYGSLPIVQQELEKFLSFYKNYSINNYSQWAELDKAVDIKLEEDYQLQLQDENTGPVLKPKKHKSGLIPEILTGWAGDRSPCLLR